MDEKNKMKMVNCLSLKTGTKVKIRKWEDLKKEYIHCGFNDEMVKCCGRIVTIKSFKRRNTDVYGLVNVFFLEEVICLIVDRGNEEETANKKFNIFIVIIDE